MLLAVDPGGTTGIAYLTRDRCFGTGQVAGGEEGMYDWITSFLNGPNPIDAIVCETFVPRPGAKSTQLDALHIIGALTYVGRTLHVPVVMQSPTQAKSFAGNDKLKTVGWWTVGADHARDATRHLLTFIITNPQAGYGDVRTVLLERLLSSQA